MSRPPQEYVHVAEGTEQTYQNTEVQHKIEKQNVKRGWVKEEWREVFITSAPH